MRYGNIDQITIPLHTERRILALKRRGGIAVSTYWLPHVGALGESIAAVWHEYWVNLGSDPCRVDARIILTANAFRETIRQCWLLFLSLSLVHRRQIPSASHSSPTSTGHAAICCCISLAPLHRCKVSSSLTEHQNRKSRVTQPHDYAFW